MVLGLVNGWRGLDNVNIHDIARLGHETSLHTTLELSELFRQCQLVSPLPSIRVLRFQRFAASRVWHLSCLFNFMRTSSMFKNFLLSYFRGPIQGENKMGRTSLALLATVLLVNALGCSSGKVRAAAPPPPPVVEVAPVIQKDVPVQGEWVGTLDGYVNAQISPQVTGYLIRQDYQEGALVKKGQVLFEIDPRPFQAVLDQAKGQLAQAEAQMANAQINVNRDIPEAEAHAIPQSQLDNDTQSLLAAKAAVQADQAAVEQASINLGYTKVLSLIDGIAGIATVEVGNLVGRSAVLTAVSQVSPIKVYFPISEQEYLRMADRGGPESVDWLTHASRIPLRLTLADGSVYPHPGRIIFADRQVNTQTGTIQIVGEFPNSRNLLRPGQYARVQAPTGNIEGALLVPQAAVNQQQGANQITVVGADNRVQLRTVQVGPTAGTLWVITSGLKPGERVVAVGADKVKEGGLVNPTPYKETEGR
jgi:RND family efflux transporter MFP subunit